jgi:DNA-binding MarR family transcriptional regulator
VDELPLLIADVFECAGALRRSGDAIAARAGQTQARWQVLSVVSEGDWTASDAARRLGVSRQNVQRIADALVADGLIAPEANPRHRRAPLLRLTPDGADVLAAITREAEPWLAEVASVLRPGEVDRARRLLQRLTAGTGRHTPF